MKAWRPKPRAGADYGAMKLNGEEGFVLSRLDGSTSVEHLVAMTGLPEGKVAKILDTLVDQGAIERDPDRAAPVPEPALRTGAAPARRPAARGAAKLASEDAAATALHEMSASVLDALTDATVEEAVPSDILDAWRREVAAKSDDVDVADPLAEATADVARPRAQTEGEDAAGDVSDSDVDASESDASAAGDVEGQDDAPVPEEEERNYRKLYETVFHPLSDDERVAAAKTEKAGRLLALCFDPLPSVVRAIFENLEAGFPHARLVANHHRTPQGLDAVVAKPELMRDQQVQRMLLRNIQLAEPQLKKLLQPKRLAQIYKITIDRDVAERNRQKARNIMRAKWSTAQAEERCELVYGTEGRCLQQLIGLPFDSHTVTLLCARPIVSLVLIQNLARFPSTTPPLLIHLMRQPTVKRQVQLRNMILQHPNCPGDLKRKA